ncbi:tape measure protein [Bacteroides sp. 51]|uniref:tape measure protein n=1 Tax=Bacteroides sp. 51 TaxID=2302938 RepID=UPI0013D51761|nr:tape measure protein [Bacteroides sp. 51]NDV81327.1 hypothetical protein [Bacteroides sp. 51]
MGIINKNGALMMAIGADASDLYRSLNQAETRIDQFGNYAKKAGVALGGVFAISGAKDFLSQLIKVRGEFQLMDTAIQTLVGNKEKADALLLKVKQYASVSPLEFKDVSKATQMLLSFNIEAENVPKYLEAIGDISMGETAKFNSLVLAFSQMSSTGKLMGQDLNQMINAGFNPLQIMAEKTGKSISQLKDEMSASAISSEMVQQAFIDATSAGGKFFGMSANAAKTIPGQISAMSDAWDTMLNTLGEKSEDVISGSIQAGTALIENYEKVGKILLSLIATFGAYKAAVIVATAIQRVHVQMQLQAALAGKALTVSQALQAVTASNLSRVWGVLNKTMLANPAVLITTIVIGLVSAMWALSDSTKAVDKAQRDYNKKKEVAIQKEQEHKQKIESLISKINEATTAELDRTGALDQLKAAYPGIIEKYITEEGHLRNIIALKKEIAELDSQAKVERSQIDLKTLDDKIRNKEEYIMGMSGSKEAIQEEIDMLNELKRQRADVQKTINSDTLNKRIVEARKMSDSDLNKMISTLKRQFGAVSDESIGQFDRSEIENYIKSLEDIQKVRANTVQNEEYWKKQKESAEKAIKAIGSEQKKLLDAGKFEGIDPAIVKTYQEQSKLLKEANKELEVYNDTSGTNNKIQSSAYELQRDADRRRIDQMHDAVDLEIKTREENISQLEDSYEKEAKMRQLSYDKEYNDVLKQQERMLRAQQDAEYDEWKKKNPDYQKKGLVFTPTTKTADQLPDDQKKQLEGGFNLAYTRNEGAEKDSLKRLLQSYQDYDTQRLEIEKRFNNDIAELRRQREEAQAKGDTKLVEQIDKALAQATKDKGKELISFDFDMLKKSPEYVRAFEDLKNTSSETLGSLLTQLDEMKYKAAETMNPDELREYTSTIQSIIDELVERDPFKALAESQKQLTAAGSELANAQARLSQVRNGAKIVTKSEKNENGELVETYLSEKDAIADVNKAKDNYRKASNTVVKAQKAVCEQMNELFDALSNVGNAIGGTAGEIIGFISDIGLFASTTMESITKVSDTTSKSLQAIEKASVILAIIGAAIQLMQKLSSFIGSAHDDYLEYADKIKDINRLTDAVNEYGIAVIKARQEEENWFAVNNLRNLRDAKELNKGYKKAYDSKLEEQQAIYQNKSGGGWLEELWKPIMSGIDSTFGKLYGFNILREYEEGTTAAAKNLRVETQSHKKYWWGGSRSQKTEDLQTWINNNKDKFEGLDTQLFDDQGMINTELAKSLLDNYGDKLVGQTEETLKALVELKEQYDEYMEQLREYVSSMYEPIVDNFVDSLWDWFDEGKDVLDSFKDYASDTFRDIVTDAMKTLAMSRIFDGFDDQLTDLYEKYAAGEMSEQELMTAVADLMGGINKKIEAETPFMQNFMNGVNSAFSNMGFDLRGDQEREASKKGFASMSQDSADELNGRFTAMQYTGEQIKELAGVIQLDVADLKKIGMTAGETLADMREIGLNQVLYLKEISKNTSELYIMNERLESMDSNLKSAKASLDSMDLKGLKLRQ